MKVVDAPGARVTGESGPVTLETVAVPVGVSCQAVSARFVTTTSVASTAPAFFTVTSTVRFWPSLETEAGEAENCVNWSTASGA